MGAGVTVGVGDGDGGGVGDWVGVGLGDGAGPSSGSGLYSLLHESNELQPWRSNQRARAASHTPWSVVTCVPAGTLHPNAPGPRQTIVTFSVTVPVGNGKYVSLFGVVSTRKTESRTTTLFATEDHLNSCP